MPAIDVVVASGVRFYAEGMARILHSDKRVSVVLAVPDVEALVSTLSAADPDVVLLDLATMDDVAALREVIGAAAPIPFVALAVRERDTDVIDWVEAGVAGVVTRSASLADLSNAIFVAARGGCACSPAVPAVLMRRVAAAARERPDTAPMPDLTAREREIMDLLSLGLSNKEIAARLFLGLSTVKNHVHHVLRKLEVTSRAEAVARMRRASGVADVAIRASARTAAERRLASDPA